MAQARSACSLIGVIALAACLAVPARAAAPTQSPTRVACPGTFQVLHNDRVGRLRLAAGAYQITVADPAKLSCAKASQNFTEFLSDYDGKLRRPWVVNAAQATFQRGGDATTAFSLARAGGSGGGNQPNTNPTANACPGFFDVEHDDHIGDLAIAEGPYRITLLNPKTISCSVAAARFAGFLQDFDGRLSTPWVLNGTTGTFTRGRGSSVGFRIKPAVGPDRRPSSGGRYPAKGQPGECPGTFRVLNRTSIDRFTFPAGPYLTFAIKGGGLGCSQVSQLFRQYLGQGSTPRGTSLVTSTGTFVRGRTPIFRAKPAR